MFLIVLGCRDKDIVLFLIVCNRRLQDDDSEQGQRILLFLRYAVLAYKVVFVQCLDYSLFATLPDCTLVLCIRICSWLVFVRPICYWDSSLISLKFY